MITCEWNKQVFYFDHEQTVQNKLILFNPILKAQNSRKGIETSHSLKTKFLLFWRGRIISKRTSNIKFISGQTYWVSVNIFTKQNWFTCTSITSRKLHLKSSRSSNSLQKIHTQNQSSALTGYPSLFLTILKRTTVATLSTLRQPGSIQQLYIIHHTKWLSCTAIHCENKKKPSRRSNLQKTEKYQGFFVLKLREIPLLSSIDRRQDPRKTGLWWWPLTSYCNVKKRISAVSPMIIIPKTEITFNFSQQILKVENLQR